MHYTARYTYRHARSQGVIRRGNSLGGRENLNLMVLGLRGAESKN